MSMAFADMRPSRIDARLDSAILQQMNELALSASVAAMGYRLGEVRQNAATKSAAWFTVYSGHGVGRQYSFPTD